jgi:mannose-6-phosphate isomerase-like protein (cupin superfamily)
MVYIVMKPGSIIPAHKHEKMAEALYAMEGDFINEGKEYLPGTSLHVKTGKQHGPHSTKRAARCSYSGRTKRRCTTPTSVISRSPSTPDLGGDVTF